MSSFCCPILSRPSLNWKQYLPFGLGRAVGTHDAYDMRDSWRLHDGTMVTMRAVRADDGPLLQELVHGLSMQSRYQRFFYPVHELTPGVLARFMQSDPHTAMTLLVVVRQNGREHALAMAQYVVDAYPQRCDFAVVVADEWQREGLGTRLLQALICIARTAGIKHFEGDVLQSNTPMQRLMGKLGFDVAPHDDDADLYRASKVLGKPEWNCSPLTALATQAVRRRPVQAYTGQHR